MNDERERTVESTRAATPDGSARRQFLRLAGCAVLAPLAGPAINEAAAAAPKLSEADSTASSLGYRQEGSKADATKYPKRTADQVCGNCKLSKGGAAGDEWIPCTLYAGKLVSTKGWCAAWSKRDA